MQKFSLRFKSPQWDAKLSPTWVKLLRPWRKRLRRRSQQLSAVKVQGVEHLRAALDRQAGILITPNHAGHADAFVLYEAVDQVARPFYFMAAWQVFAQRGWFGRWLLRRCGCFSVDREGTDLRAFKRAVQIVTDEPYPLVVFPEGEVYHLNDRVTPFREGSAVVALSAAKRAERPILILPAAIKYHYVEDPTSALEAMMSELERRILWRPQTELPLAERIYRFAKAALALKEVEYLGGTREGPGPPRARELTQHLLQTVEQAHGLSARNESVPERVKNVRHACLEALEAAADDPARQEQIRRQLDDVFLAIQLFSYPGDYVSERPTVERLAETIDKFEEDILDRPLASIRAARRAVLKFGEPIDAAQFAQSAPQPRKAARPLTDALEHRVQELLNGMG